MKIATTVARQVLTVPSKCKNGVKKAIAEASEGIWGRMAARWRDGSPRIKEKWEENTFAGSEEEESLYRMLL